MKLCRIRNLMRPLRMTPLHPQWLVLKSEKQNYKFISQKLSGQVLDIGCGNRHIEPHLKSDVHYIGLDYPSTHAKGYSGHPDIFGDGQCLPFNYDFFDSVIVLDVLEHLPSPNDCVQESARVLKSGGQLILQTPFLYPLHDMPHDFQRWTLPGLKRLVEEHGFSLVEQHVLGTPCETAAALLAISLANAILNSLQQRSSSILLIPLFIAGIFFANLFGWLMSHLLPADDFMPLSYQIFCKKL